MPDKGKCASDNLKTEIFEHIKVQFLRFSNICKISKTEILENQIFAYIHYKHLPSKIIKLTITKRDAKRCSASQKFNITMFLIATPLYNNVLTY